MTILNNIQIENRQAEAFIRKHKVEELSSIISNIFRELEIEDNKEQKQFNKKSKWAKFAEKIHEKSPLDGVSEEANKLFKQFREESSF